MRGSSAGTTFIPGRKSDEVRGDKERTKVFTASPHLHGGLQHQHLTSQNKPDDS